MRSGTRCERASPEPAGSKRRPCAASTRPSGTLRGHIAGKPPHRLLGATRDRIPVYASHDMWMSVPAKELAERAASFVAEGYGALKIRAGGSADPVEDGRRLEMVRQVVGPGVKVMYDAIQHYGVEEAIAIGKALEPHGLYWLEDPVPEKTSKERPPWRRRSKRRWLLARLWPFPSPTRG